jgi:phasin protein
MWRKRQSFDFDEFWSLVQIYAAVQKKYLKCRTAASISFSRRRKAEHPPSTNQSLRILEMTKTPDMTAMFKDVMGSFPVDTAAMEDAFKTSATLNEKLSGVALTAVEKSTEISSKWTKDTLAKMADMSKAKAEPADYAKAMTDFASASAETAAEHMAAFAEIAKKVQMDTVELMMAAGKDMQEDATAAVKKASNDVQAAAKKATAK